MYSSMQKGRLLCSLARPCRFIAHRRYPAVVTSPLRRFHLSQTWRSSTPSDPNDARNPASEDLSSGVSALNGSPSSEQPDTPVEALERPGAKDSPYGSASRRAFRNRKRSEKAASPTYAVPDWFRERNTVLREEGVGGLVHIIRAARQDKQASADEEASADKEVSADKQASADKQTSGDSEDKPPATDGQSVPKRRYAVAVELWAELQACARAGLRLPPAKYATEPSAQKSHLALHYPGLDGVRFLDAVVKQLAWALNADLMTLGAQDIAQLCTEQDLADTGKTSPIRLLGYEVFRPPPLPEADDKVGEEDEGEVDPRNLQPGELAGPKVITIESSRAPGDIPIQLPGLRSLLAAVGGSPDNSAGGTAPQQPADRVQERRLQLLHKLLSFSETAEQEVLSESGVSQPGLPRDIIVQVQDYDDIQATREGSRFLSLLQRVIQDRRKDGNRILFIGTAAKEIPPGSDSLRLVQNAFDDQFSQMLVVTPAMSSEAIEKELMADRKRRALDVNIRHLESMAKTRIGGMPQDPSWSPDVSVFERAGLYERYWSYNEVHRTVTLALGTLKADETYGIKHIQRALRLIEKIDPVRDTWLRERTPKSTRSETDYERRIIGLAKICNQYEKKLLRGVVDAKSIRTTFSDVHVPPETIDALKSLTSLSFMRPDAFKYGVLASDKIPGLLLYGPPGTGKTLLAKAVARQSGATVLQVSASDVYDKYVGEGEKNVKAVFSLAKKLSPCVVFIDEADSILRSRNGSSGGSNRGERALINQFLQQWDGMQDLSTFIMVATNRPFDLDDAVLRRLPRRLLVDLPTEQDRLAILKIHLKEETLDASVDLAELARRTPLHSGSDLKNLCVAAALACVKEENALAEQHKGEEPYQYPERRTLTWTHFTRGMEEISASISDDTSTLSAIRKFDEKYGDRKGRRKKSAGWGFTTVPVSDQAESDAARVRS